MPPVAIALIIVVAVALVGGIIAYVRARTTVRGYEDIAGAARQIATAFKAEIFRDANDLVIAGNYKKLPTIIRFSYDENTPGLNIRMNAPASFTMSVVPKGARASEGRVQVRTPNDMFDARFTTRSDQPTQAKMLLGSKVVQSNLEKLCCSSKTFFTMTRGSLELSELVIPEQFMVRHILDHVESLRVVAEGTKQMPGAEAVKVESLHRERRLIARTAIAVGVVVTIIAVAAAMRSPQQELQAKSAIQAPDGLPPAAAAVIMNLTDWRLATPADLENDAAGWARANGQPPSGAISGHFGSQDGPLDGAYILLNAQGDHRVVMLAGTKVVWDVSIPKLAAVVRVPKDLFAATEWKGGTQPQPDGDGLLLVRDPDDRGASTVVYLQNGKPASAVPADYQRVRLQ